jgi:hypothetical protein
MRNSIVALGSLFLSQAQAIDPVASRILHQALRDGIDLASFSFTAPALEEIIAWTHFDAEKNVSSSLLHPAPNASTVDVHGTFNIHVLRLGSTTK